MKWWLPMLILAVGCAGHTVAETPHHPPVALDTVVVTPPRAGQLSASREWERYPGNRVIAHDEGAELRAAFTRALEARLPLTSAAPVHVRATLMLQDTGYYEGLAAETTDVTLRAELVDERGAVYRTITMREAASAPLQRSASRKARLDAAVDRLAARLAAAL